MRWLWVPLLALALAQAPKPLRVGPLAGEALYPGNRGVSYGEAELLARGLGLALWRTEKEVALGLGSRYRRFPVLENEGQAVRQQAAWLHQGKVYVPLRPLAEALGLQYQAQAGVALSLPWAVLLGVEREQDRLVLRFSREVNALVRPGGILFLLAQGQGAGFRQEAEGLFLSLDTPPDRLYYPGGGRVALEWGPLSKPAPLVLLDPGHGGEDPGLVLDGVSEKDLTLDLARRVARRLPQARLTRTQDVSLSLEDRLAQAKQASVLVSLHVTRGREVNLYLPDGRTGPLAQSAPELLRTAPEEQARLLKAYAGDPRQLAEALEKAFGALGIPVARAEGPYALTDIPGAAVLLEIGAERLATPEAREALAQAIAQALEAYLP
ncbi:hypothetical protein GCM10007092_04160 [Thermus composti]|uniref:N-acetylmuramoyl-L-alanine amidase n=1 Tax=Thermus composti TaxID=532059 RepID=A0ABV6PZ35_9DEIN|nr:N-acetylmuramoyl-L-alanine amidase [Thermus composti]GGM93988.1 hypothetical protein GCM10007092_04160 [Thermus composti]